MVNSNIIYNASNLDGCQKTLDVVADNITFFSNKFRKWMEYSLNGAKNIVMIYKRGYKFLKEKIPICPVCTSANVDENGGRTRTIIFSTGKEDFKIQGYICKNHHENGKSQYFEANIDGIVPNNSNYSHEFINVVKDHNAPVHAPVRVTADFFNRTGLLSVSPPTIQNIIFSTENPNELPEISSGKYTFDVLWSKAHGGWKSFYFCMNDAYNRKVIHDGIFTSESAFNLDTFFKEISPYLPEEKYVTVDLNPKYKKPLKKHGFKRQFCQYHTPKAIKTKVNDLMKAYKKKGGIITVNDKKIIEEKKKKIVEMLLTPDLKVVDVEFKEIMDNFDSLHPCIQQLMNKLIIPNFDDFFWYLKVRGVEKTSNITELTFQKSLPKHVKRRMRILEGSEKRIHLKQEYRNKKSDEKFEKQIFNCLLEIIANNDHI
jgi:hypothetical protein